jgi:hypothetical protein
MDREITPLLLGNADDAEVVPPAISDRITFNE